ncbi:lantibiotic dehydratase family protein [Streptomyces sp. Je 1-79]|uniref:lantibiotic dehydratase family protein n=1 Tax=Streptomyces sp. Je 1-79 TaxID=2943847 RepID=UPI0021A6B767|nr:lantibiotic dehydratase family protein [Streptomyces sp. Je 1-79]MCT4353371.1 lantibiotic dehydratase family protein [Streptomyces sp. Je 1-79]
MTPFVLRVAGLPVETVRELRCPDSRRWADEVAEAADALGRAGEAVGDLLHDLIGRTGEGDEGVRRRLLALRRAVFNGRPPQDPDGARELVAGLDAEAGRALAAWLADHRALTERRAVGAALLAEETGRARTALGRRAGEERLRRALLLASPALHAQLDTYVRAVEAAPTVAEAAAAVSGKKQRKIERSLLSYLYRTVCKTSPFSTFTGVALGEFAEGAESGGLAVRVDDEWTGHARLNVVALGRIAETIAADPVRRADLPVSLASGWGRDDDRVRYVRRWVTAGDDDTAVTFDAVRDRLFFLRRSGTLERLLGLFEERGTLRHGEVADWLAAEHGTDSDDVERYLGALLDVGMLQVPGLRTEVHDTDPLRAFQASLRAVERPWADELVAALDGPVSLVDRFAHAAPADRPALLAALRDGLREIQLSLGADEGRVPQTVLYEDAAAGTATGLDADAWARLAAGPLARVERVLPAFDLTLPQRLILKGFFLARHGRGGRCDDLLKLVHDFHEDFFEQYMSFTAKRTTFDTDGRYVPEENWLGQPELKALDTARMSFVERMRSLWRESTSGGTDEIVLDDAFMAEVANELDGLAPHFAPMSHHIQLADRTGGPPLLVLNRSYGGLSFPFSRFTHCFEGLAERLLEGSDSVVPPGAVLAEVTGGPVTSNLNLHGRLTPYEIVCPGETGTLEPEYRIGLDDLSVVHDERTDRLVLRSARLGRDVVPVYLGYLVPLALPELARTLLLLSPTSMAPLNVWGGVPEGEPVAGVTSRPRVRHGALVLARRSWSAPASVLPLRAAGGGDGRDGSAADAEWFLGWHRFRRAHGLPDRVFATVSDSGARGATGAKPQYLDFDSALSLAAFEALLKSAEARVVFREALPDEDALHVTTGRGRHVAELAVETLAPAAATPRSAQSPQTRKGNPR